MPTDAPDTQSPAATAVADPPAAASPGSTAASDRPTIGSPSSFDAIFAKALEGIPQDDPNDPPALNGDAQPAETPAATAKDAEPTSDPPAERVSASETPDEAVKPGGEPSLEDAEASSRRKNVGAEKDAEIATLKQQLAERDPEVIKASLRDEVRAEIETEATRKATEAVDEDFLGNQERFERLSVAPSVDLSQEDFNWLEERKDRRQQWSPVERHIRSIYEQRLAAARTADRSAMDGHHAGIMAGIGEEIRELASLPGVDASSWKTPGTTFRDYGKSLYDGALALGASQKEAELLPRVEKAEAEATRAKKEIQDLQLSLRDGTPAPIATGRSAANGAQKPAADPGGSWESNLGAAFGWSA